MDENVYFSSLGQEKKTIELVCRGQVKRYAIEKSLGNGGFGFVLAAYEKSEELHHTKAAIKLVPFGSAFKEFSRMKKVGLVEQHHLIPNLVENVLCYYTADDFEVGATYDVIVMERMAGDLRKIMKENSWNPIIRSEIARVAYEVLREKLLLLFQLEVHYWDLKLANVLVTETLVDYLNNVETYAFDEKSLREHLEDGLTYGDIGSGNEITTEYIHPWGVYTSQALKFPHAEFALAQAMLDLYLVVNKDRMASLVKERKSSLKKRSKIFRSRLNRPRTQKQLKVKFDKMFQCDWAYIQVLRNSDVEILEYFGEVLESLLIKKNLHLY